MNILICSLSTNNPSVLPICQLGLVFPGGLSLLIPAEVVPVASEAAGGRETAG